MSEQQGNLEVQVREVQRVMNKILDMLAGDSVDLTVKIAACNAAGQVFTSAVSSMTLAATIAQLLGKPPGT